MQVESVGARAGHKEALQSQLAITQIQVSFHSATAVLYMESPNTDISHGDEYESTAEHESALLCKKRSGMERELNQSFRTSPVFTKVRFTAKVEKPVK